jgi:hypothetical protein
MSDLSNSTRLNGIYRIDRPESTDVTDREQGPRPDGGTRQNGAGGWASHSRADRGRLLLWWALGLCVAGNTVASLVSDSTLVHLVPGVLGVACVAALVAVYLRRR